MIFFSASHPMIIQEFSQYQYMQAHPSIIRFSSILLWRLFPPVTWLQEFCDLRRANNLLIFICFYMSTTPLNLVFLLFTLLRLDFTYNINDKYLTCTLNAISFFLFFFFFNYTWLKSWVVIVWSRTGDMIMLMGVWNRLEIVTKISRGIIIKYQKNIWLNCYSDWEQYMRNVRKIKHKEGSHS